jgi:hypothetical protein
METFSCGTKTIVDWYLRNKFNLLSTIYTKSTIRISKIEISC